MPVKIIEFECYLKFLISSFLLGVLGIFAFRIVVNGWPLLIVCIVTWCMQPNFFTFCNPLGSKHPTSITFLLSAAFRLYICMHKKLRQMLGYSREGDCVTWNDKRSAMKSEREWLNKLPPICTAIKYNPIYLYSCIHAFIHLPSILPQGDSGWLKVKANKTMNKKYF